MSTANTSAAHLDSVRQRGRRLLDSQDAGWRSHELLQAATACRDGAIVIAILWSALYASHNLHSGTRVLFTAAVALAVYTGVANTMAVASQLRYWNRELQREREEIRLLPCREREEIRAIYEAKGFSGETLDRIVETLAADEDRLLKVMLEEELGVFLEQRNHPVIVGLSTGAASALGGLAAAAGAAGGSIPALIVTLLLVLACVAVIRRRLSVRLIIESLVRWTVVAATTVGIAYYLGQLLT